MRRYHFLLKSDVFEALNNLRDAFLAAKNGEEVDEIINGLLTYDEKMKIGRRIVIEQSFNSQTTNRELAQIHHVGTTTIQLVRHLSELHPKCYQLIDARRKHLEKTYENKKTINHGGSKLVYKKNVYSGFRRKDVKR